MGKLLVSDIGFKEVAIVAEITFNTCFEYPRQLYLLNRKTDCKSENGLLILLHNKNSS